LAICAVLVLSGTAEAVNARWSNSTSDGSWSDASNWSGPATIPLAGDNINFDWFTGYPAPYDLVDIDVQPLGDGSTFGKNEHKYYGGGTIDLNGHWIAFSNGMTIYRVQNGPVQDWTWQSTGATGTINTSAVNANNYMVFDGGFSRYTFGVNADVNVSGSARTGSGNTAGNSGLCVIRLTDNADFNVDNNLDVGSLGEPLQTGLLDLSGTSVLTVGGTMNVGDDGAGDGGVNFGEVLLTGGGVTTSIGTGNFENGKLTYELTSPPSTLNITGNLNIGTVEIDIDITGSAPAVGTVYTLVDVGGTMTGAFTLAAEDVGQWTLTHTTGGSGQVTATYVPEPMTMLLVGGGLLALIRRR
jgi:hypothetical protein